MRRDHGSVVSSNLDAGAPQEAALGQFTPLDPPRPAPALSFTGRDGRALKLADFRGHFVLVNLWATWCGPCVEEMPALAALSRTLAPADIAVLPLSSDRGGATAVEAFFRKHAKMARVIPRNASLELDDIEDPRTKW